MASIAVMIKRLNVRDFLHDMRKACRAHHVTLEEVLGDGRSRLFVRAREDCIMIMLDAGLSLEHAGRLIGRHHTTLMEARRRWLRRKRVA